MPFRSIGLPAEAAVVAWSALPLPTASHSEVPAARSMAWRPAVVAHRSRRRARERSVHGSLTMSRRRLLRSARRKNPSTGRPGPFCAALKQERGADQLLRPEREVPEARGPLFRRRKAMRPGRMDAAQNAAPTQRHAVRAGNTGPRMLGAGARRIGRCFSPKAQLSAR